MKVRQIAKAKSWTNLGNRCKEFTWHCIVCEHYKYLDTFGKFPTDAEVEAWAVPYRAEYDANDTTVWYPWKDISTRFGKRGKS